MLRILISMVLIIPAAVPAWSQACGTVDLIAELTAEDRARLDQFVSPHPFSTGNIWKAERDDSNVLVVGTMHIPDQRLSDIFDRVVPELAKSDLLILESTTSAQSEVQQLAVSDPDFFFITDGPTMIDLLGPVDWALAESRLNELGVPGFLGAKFQPWYMNLVLMMPPCAFALLQTGEKGLDGQFESYARDRDIPIATLDDVKALMGLFADGSTAEQLEILRLTLHTQQDTAAIASTTIQAYFDGRSRELWEFMRILVDQMEIEGGLEAFEEMDSKLLVGRNQKWEPLIADLVAGKTTVLAVGAAHLSGETGVLRALERAGFDVRAF